MKILLLSAYDTPSHRYWCEGLMAQFSQFKWTYLTLPARYYSWRVRGNPLSWTYLNNPDLQKPCDLIIATSMVDLATLRGLNPQLAWVPALLYFHENQFAYPVSQQQTDAVAAQMVSLYSALSAQRIVFNSEYNRSSFFIGLAQLLKKLPDNVPKDIVEMLTQKSTVLPVPLADCAHTTERSINRGDGGTGVQIIWNHRWEYDKGPEQLLHLVKALPEGLNLKVHVVGQQFRKAPEAFEFIRSSLDAKFYLGEYGYITSKTVYSKLLSRSDFVLSTALHDFQGLSVLEAVQAGCIPLVPNRLAYSEFFDSQYRYPSVLNDPAQEARGAVERLVELIGNTAARQRAPSVAAMEWQSLKLDYQNLIETCKDLKTGLQGV